VWLKHGDADLDAFRAGVERIAGGNPVEIYPKRTIQASLKRSIHFQVQALWLLATLGGLATLLAGSTLQSLALALYLPFDGLVSLYLVSAVFGLAQGGIVPSYALVVRDHFPAREAGTRVSLVLMATIVGMALGGWLSGELYDRTGSYAVALWHGIAWNLVNLGLAFLVLLARRPVAPLRASAG